MAKGKLTVTLAYSYEIDPDDYPVRESIKMAELDIEQDPAVVFFDGDWVIKGATFEAYQPSDAVV